MTKVAEDKKESKPKLKQPVSLRCLGPVADLENHLPQNWWKALFNSIYLKTDSDVVENEANTKADVDSLLAVTNLKTTDRHLDLCCGQGRHVIELAKRGFRQVSGVDRSRYLIRLAKKRSEKLHLSKSTSFSEGDARKIRFPQSSFDCVSILGNSFGYFEQQDDDLKVLKEVNRVLRTNGTLYLDIADGDWIRKNFTPRGWEWIDQTLFVCRERHLSSDQSRLICREVVVNANKGVITDQFYAERLYDFSSMKNLLERAGFHHIEMIGKNVESASTRDQDLGMMANRLIVKAQASVKKEALPSSPKVKTKVAVVFGDPKLPDPIKRNGKFNQEDLETIHKLKTTLKELKDFEFNWIDDHSALLPALSKKRPDLIFNLCDEGFQNDPHKELHVPALFEMLNIPYTGCPPVSLALCYDKAIVRAIAASLDIPVPEEIVIDPANTSAAIPEFLPALLKPAKGDSSAGITQHAVVNTTEELVTYFDWLRTKFPGMPILAQEFLSGREFSVGIVGNAPNYDILPILEVDYSKLPPELPKILSYESKWLPSSPYWTSIQYKEAKLDEQEMRSLIDASTRLFERLECRDYVRFDFRADSQGVIKLLEVNPNPGWCWDGKFNLMASFGGMSYETLLHKILCAAQERIQGGM